MRSVSKDSLSPSATRHTESNVASSSTCRRRPLQKGFLSAGKLTATGITVDEKQLISWARTNRPKKIKKDRHVKFRSWSSKSQEAKMMHDLLQPTEIAWRRSSSVAHLYACLDRGTKAWVNSQDLLPFVWFLLVDFPVASRDRDRRRNWPRTERRQKVSDAKSEKSVRSALQNTVGRVSRSRDLFLFGLMIFFFFFFYCSHARVIIFCWNFILVTREVRWVWDPGSDQTPVSPVRTEPDGPEKRLVGES